MRRLSDYQPNERAADSGRDLQSPLVSSIANVPSLLRHQEKVRNHAETRLGAVTNSLGREAIVRELRGFLRLEDERLRVADRLGAGGLWIASARSFTIDLLIGHAFRHAREAVVDPQAPTNNEASVVAIGGYGRAELAPFSDLDILFLYSGRAQAQTQEIVERCLHLLWDAGLNVAQKSHAAAECIPAARTDPHFQTALINSRLVSGNDDLYLQLLGAIDRDRAKNKTLLLKTIRQEREHLLQKRGVTVYLQEPNVKESAGGLRDLHCALWSAYAEHGYRALSEIREHVGIEAAQYERLIAAYDFLLRARHHAHWISGRKTDYLTLDLQDTIARKLGYSSSLDHQPSEQFMRDYYRHARELHQFGETWFGRIVDRLQGSRGWLTGARRLRLDPMFSVKDRRLYFDGSPGLFAEDPLLPFKAAALAQSRSLEFSSDLSDCIRQNLAAIDPNCRKSSDAARAFLALLGHAGRVSKTLRLLHETGVLGRYLPEFDRITVLIQHDFYHHYTVDEHTLRTIGALDELDGNQETTLSSLRAALNEVEDVRLLYLALLLHDLGKGRGRGHIPRGARIAERICDRLGLDSGSKTKVVQLVRHHVLMAHLSQRRDLRELRVAKHFASQVGSLDVLNMLFVLTYADLNGVGPGVWSDWKGTLLEELYARTRVIFTGESLVVQDDLQQLKERVIKGLSGTISISEIERHFALCPNRYLKTTTAEEVQSHVLLVRELESKQFACQWQDQGDFATRLTVAARDRHGLFADIAGTLAASGIEILSADVNTREDGIAIDTFILRQATTHRSIDHHRWHTIARSFETAIKGEHDVAALVERWRIRHAPRRPYRGATNRSGYLTVSCDNEAAEATTLVEIRAPDRHGLAYNLAHTLTAFGLEIVCAKIATEKSDALDVFYVTTATGAKLDEAAMRELEKALTKALTSEVVTELSAAIS